jgi:hypothetical protein
MGDLEPKINAPAIATRVVAKTLLGSLPVAGPLLVAVFDEIVPVFRAERLQGFAEELDIRLNDTPRETLIERLKEPARYDILEDALWQAVRTSSRTRLAHLATIVANGMKASDADEIDRRHLLTLLGQLNDVQVLLLSLYGRTSMASRNEYWDKHKEALEHTPATMGSPTPVVDRDRIRDSYGEQLLQLGLLEKNYWTRSSRDELKFDRKGRLEGGTLDISYLGRLLLREIGSPSELDEV